MQEESKSILTIIRETSNGSQTCCNCWFHHLRSKTAELWLCAHVAAVRPETIQSLGRHAIFLQYIVHSWS